MKQLLSWLAAGLLALAAIGAAPAHAQRWLQIQQFSGTNVCGEFGTGLEDHHRARFLSFERFFRDGQVRSRIDMRFGSAIVVRLIGHGIDLVPADRFKRTGSLRVDRLGSGRYVWYPPNDGTLPGVPMAYVDLKVWLAEPTIAGGADVVVEPPFLAPVRIPFNIVYSCPQTVFSAQRCFGATGMMCGNLLPPQPSSCVDGKCLVTGGSWRHDECCVRSPNGKVCGGPGPEVPLCADAWDTAVDRIGGAASRLQRGYAWVRIVDPNAINTSGTVNGRLYCAPRGTRVHPGDAALCCASQGAADVEPSDAERQYSAALLQTLGPVAPVRGYSAGIGSVTQATPTAADPAAVVCP